MSEQARTFKIAKIPADGVGREVVEAGQQVPDCVAGQSDGKLAFAWKEFRGDASTTDPGQPPTSRPLAITDTGRLCGLRCRISPSMPSVAERRYEPPRTFR